MPDTDVLKILGGFKTQAEQAMAFTELAGQLAEVKPKKPKKLGRKLTLAEIAGYGLKLPAAGWGVSADTSGPEPSFTFISPDNWQYTNLTWNEKGELADYEAWSPEGKQFSKANLEVQKLPQSYLQPTWKFNKQLTPDEIKQFGFTLPADWKVNADMTGPEPSFAFISPDNWQYTNIVWDETGKMIDYQAYSPEGEMFHSSQLETLGKEQKEQQDIITSLEPFKTPEGLYDIGEAQKVIPKEKLVKVFGEEALGGTKEYQVQWPVPGGIGPPSPPEKITPEQYQEYRAKEQDVEAQYLDLAANIALILHPDTMEPATDTTVESILSYAKNDPNGFLQWIIGKGRKPETEDLIRSLYNATDEEIAQLFAPHLPTLPRYYTPEGKREVSMRALRPGEETRPVPTPESPLKQALLANPRLVKTLWEGLGVAMQPAELAAKGATVSLIDLLRSVGSLLPGGQPPTWYQAPQIAATEEFIEQRFEEAPGGITKNVLEQAIFFLALPGGEAIPYDVYKLARFIGKYGGEGTLKLAGLVVREGKVVAEQAGRVGEAAIKAPVMGAVQAIPKEGKGLIKKPWMTNAPFTQEEVTGFNRYSHFEVDINKDFARQIEKKTGEVFDKLKTVRLPEMPENVAEALGNYRKTAYQYYLEKSRATAIAPPTSVVGPSKYKGRPDKANAIMQRALLSLENADKQLQGAVREASKGKVHLSQKEITHWEPLFNTSKSRVDFGQQYAEVIKAEKASIPITERTRMDNEVLAGTWDRVYRGKGRQLYDDLVKVKAEAPKPGIPPTAARPPVEAPGAVLPEAVAAPEVAPVAKVAEAVTPEVKRLSSERLKKEINRIEGEILYGEQRLESKKNAIGQKLTQPEIDAIKRQVESDKQTLTGLKAQLAPPKAEAIPEGIPPVAKVAEAPAIEAVPKPAEKAANIRLEKFPEELRDTIKEWADTHPEEVTKGTRGIVSDAQVKLGAEKLVTEVGGDLGKLEKKWKPGTAWSAEELVAIRSVLSEKTQAVLNAQKIVKETNSAQNLLKLQVALKEQAAVQEMVHGLTAEAGRALRSFRQQVFDAISSNDLGRMEELLKKIGGREWTEKVSQLIGQLDVNDPLAVNKFIQNIYKPKFMDYAIEWFYNSILSGPKTHIVNSLSNTVNAVFSPIERGVSSLVDIPLAAIQKRPRARFLNEIPADTFGAIRGIPEGFRRFAYVIKNGISLDQATKWEFRQVAFKGKAGAAINMPSRFLEAADQLMKSINLRAALNAEAYRMASMEKLVGEAFESRVAELLSNPTVDMLRRADKIAEYRLFRQEPGKFGQTLMNMREAVDIGGLRPLRFVIPFLRTPMNLVKYGLERTPAGFLNPKLWAKVAQKDPEAADQIARATIGSIGMAALSWHYVQGNITGAPPRNRAERERFYREGKQPYALRIDGFWVSYQRLEPFNQLLSQVAVIGDMIRDEEKGVSEKITDAVNTFGQNFVSQTYMSSVSDLLEMLSEPERYAGNWLNRFATSMAIPMSAATRTATQALDQIVRNPQNIIETFEANIPGLSERVQSKITALGEDIARKSPQWFPINVTPVEETVLSQELERLEFDIGFAGKTISGIELTDAEQRDYQILSGQLIKQDLSKLMLAPEYWLANDIDRDKMLRKVTNAARDWAQGKAREKIWTTGITEERIKVLETALSETDKKLGKVISEVPAFTHEKPNIYDVALELDSSYRSLLKDIPEEALKGMKVPPSVSSWYAKEKATQIASGLPNQTLSDINADKTKGSIFEDYYQQWLERLKVTDERELEKFDKKYPDANLGNISRRELDLLREYHSLDKSKQEQFLKDNPGLALNPYLEWLKTHPKENAQLAVWGQAKLGSLETYNEAKKLIKEVDFPDKTLPDFTLPPDKSVANYFKYREQGEKLGYNSSEAKLIVAEDEQLRDFLKRDPIDTPIPILRIDVKWRAQDKEYQAILDKYPDSQTAEQTKATKEYLVNNPDYAVGRIKRDGYELGLPEPSIPQWVEYNQLPDYGFWRERYRLEHPEFDTSVQAAKKAKREKPWDTLEPEKIPLAPYDEIYEQFKDLFEQYENVEGTPTEKVNLRKQIFEQNPYFKEAWYRRFAYGKMFPEEFVEDYVNYNLLPDKGYVQERYLLTHRDFYAEATKRLGWSKIIDPLKIPSVRIEKLYNQYETLSKTYDAWYARLLEDTMRYRRVNKLIADRVAKEIDLRDTAQEKFRRANPDLDAWMVRSGKVSKLIGAVAKPKAKATAPKPKTTAQPPSWAELKAKQELKMKAELKARLERR